MVHMKTICKKITINLLWRYCGEDTTTYGIAGYRVVI